MFQIGWIFEHSDLVGRLENTLFLMHFKLLSQNQRVGGKKDIGKTNIYSDITK